MSIDPKVLKQVRKALGLSQQELADRLSLSRVTVNKMERGKLARGIPDEIGKRLMGLKTWKEPLDALNDSPHGDAPDASTTFGSGRLDDNHLWDNGEDDQ